MVNPHILRIMVVKCFVSDKPLLSTILSFQLCLSMYVHIFLFIVLLKSLNIVNTQTEIRVWQFLHSTTVWKLNSLQVLI